MRTFKSALAAAELLLVLPAALFMTALFVRNLQPQPYEPAHTAQRIVDWYAANPHIALWFFLMAMPLAVLSIGLLALVKSWRADAGLRQSARELAGIVRGNLATALIALATVASGCILAIVALHMVAD